MAYLERGLALGSAALLALWIVLEAVALLARRSPSGSRAVRGSIAWLRAGTFACTGIDCLLLFREFLVLPTTQQGGPVPCFVVIGAPVSLVLAWVSLLRPDKRGPASTQGPERRGES